jgi:hypothetical protein
MANNSLDPFAQFNEAKQQKTYASYQRKKLNMLEKITISISVVVLVVISIFGFWSQNTRNRDAQREEDIAVILEAINSFYVNSNLVPSQRTYPVADCSEKLNEVDFEFTLRQYLGGLRPAYDPHTYINPDNFPNDPWGSFSVNLNERETELRNCPKIFNERTLTGQTVYSDSYPSCNFDQSRSTFRKCYLYTSSNNGDSFELAYFSEAQGGFVIYSRFREEPLRVLEG